MKPMTTLRLFSIATMASTTIFLASCGEKKEGEAETNTEAPEAGAEVAQKDIPDSLTDELIVQFNDLGEAMMSAKDKASAEEAVRKLNDIINEIEAIAARLEKLETPSDEERVRIEEKMDAAGNAMSEKMGDSMQTIMSNQEVASILGPAFMDLGARMNALNPVFERFGKPKEATEPEAATPATPDGPAAPAPAAPAATEPAAE